MLLEEFLECVSARQLLLCGFFRFLESRASCAVVRNAVLKKGLRRKRTYEFLQCDLVVRNEFFEVFLASPIALKDFSQHLIPCLRHIVIQLSGKSV